MFAGDLNLAIQLDLGEFGNLLVFGRIWSGAMLIRWLAQNRSGNILKLAIYLDRNK